MNLISVHTPVCRSRFNALVRADRVASGTKTPGTPSAPTLAVEPAAEHPLDPEPETDEFVGVETTDLPFSAGIPPESEPAMVGRVAFALDESFSEINRSRNMSRRMSSLSGRGMLYEYACSDTSIIGERLADIGIRCTRLTRGGNPDHVAQAIMQLQSTPGADVWIALPCTHFSPIQRRNKSQHGTKFKKKLKQGQQETRRMLGYALQFAEACHQNSGRVAFEHSQESGIWESYHTFHLILVHTDFWLKHCGKGAWAPLW